METTLSQNSNFVPAKEKHSVSEAILSLFTQQPLINPRRFKALTIEGGALHGTFQSFKLRQTKQISAQFNPLENVAPDMRIGDTEDIGFLIESFVNGEVDWAIQHESGELFSVISFHCFNYTRWDSFIEKCNELIAVLFKFDSAIYFHTIGLTYKDEFHWIEEKNINSKLLFNENNRYVPAIVFESIGDWNYTCSHTLLLGEDKIPVIEHITVNSVRVSKERQTIAILHNSGYTIPNSPILLNDLTLTSNIKPICSRIHQLNKDFLAHSLHPDVRQRISLT